MSVFEFFFKYTPYVYQQGNFVFVASLTTIVVALVLAAAAAPAILRYRAVRAKSSAFDRAFLATLRILALIVLFFCMMQPSLVVSTAVPQENFVGILIDNSRSMRVTDYGGEGTEQRSAFVRDALGDPDSDLVSALSERFKLRYFGFSSTPERLTSLDSLLFNGEQTQIGPALDFARQELAAVPLSGLILVTDGADNSIEGLASSLQSLRGSSIPVFPIGVGVERFDRDIEVASVEAPRRVLSGSSVAADVVIEHKGFGGTEVLLLVEGPDGVVGTEQVELPRQGDSTVVKAHFTAEHEGPHLYRFRISVEEGEMVRENNEQDVLIVVQDREDKILYFEGEPTNRIGFMRSFGLNDDPNILLTVMDRTAENKFWNLRHSEDEIATGFPTTRDELFQYRGLIFGSIEANFFTDDQQQMVYDFVSQRGGGFLMLGGRHAFGEGGWHNTPVADILPVALEPPFGSEQDPFFVELSIVPTLFGKTHPVTQMADSVDMSVKHWETLPPLAVLNRVSEAKPGAVTILEGTNGNDAPVAVLAFQRFGRGKSLAFTPVNPWYWQMAFEIPLEDMTHETLWQQLMRWLVNDVPGQVAVSTVVDRYAPGAPIRVTATVLDETYIEVNNAHVMATITSPAGLERQLEMDWTIDADGLYTTTFIPEELGFHSITVDATRGDESLGSDTGYVEVATLSTEAFASERRTSLLERIAEETGGRWYTPQNVDALPGDLRYSEGGTTVLEVKDLWDIPLVFFLLVALIGTEWGYRKLKGLA